MFLFSFCCFDIAVIADEGFLCVLVPKDHLVFLHILDFGILRYASLVVSVVLLYGLNNEGWYIG